MASNEKLMRRRMGLPVITVASEPIVSGDDRLNPVSPPVTMTPIDPPVVTSPAEIAVPLPMARTHLAVRSLVWLDSVRSMIAEIDTNVGQPGWASEHAIAAAQLRLAQFQLQRFKIRVTGSP